MINKLNYDILNEGVNYSVYSKYCDGDNLQDLLSNVFAKINEMIEDVNTYTECIKKTVEWITGNGLNDLVIKELNKMYEKGVFNDIISNVIFLDLKQAIKENADKISELDKKVDNKLNEYDNKIEDKFNSFNESLSEKLKEFKKLIDSINEEIEKFNAKYEEDKQENLKNEKVQNDKIAENLNKINKVNDRIKVLDFNLSEIKPISLFKCKLAEGSVSQSTIRDLITSEYFVTQVWYGPEGDSESYTITRLDKQGNYVDWCRCKHGGHGTSMGIENENGITYIWANWDITDSQGNHIGNKVVRFPYQSRKTLELSDRSIQEFDTFENIYMIPVIDQLNDLIAFRVKYSEENQKIRVYKLSEFKKGVNNILSEFTIPYKYNYLQGLSILEDKFYIRTGDTNSANWRDYLVEFDWKTGTEIQKVECTFHLDNEFGDVDNFREPEGVFAYRDNITKLITILTPLTVGEEGQRQYPIWAYNQLGADGKMIGELFGNVQKTILCMENSTCKELPKHVTALKDWTEAGWYYINTQRVKQLTDLPSTFKESGCFIFNSPNNEFVGGEGKAMVQEVVRNGITSFDKFYRVRNNKGEVGAWYEVNVTKVE